MSAKYPKAVFCGLFSYKPRWGFTWLGWVALLVAVPLAGTFLVWRIYPFLAVSKPVSTDVMVVEGWIAAPLLKVAAEKFQEGHYKSLYTIGGSFGNDTSERESLARVAANRLIQLGVSPECIIAVPLENEVFHDRTYSNAVALRKWFESNGVSVDSLNVVTEGPHSRRSRRIFKTAFNKDISIGVISVPPLDYDPRKWWHYSEGVKEVLSETAAYVYVYLRLNPDYSSESPKG